MRNGMRVAAALIVVALITSACSSDKELANLAVATCDQLEDSIVLTAGLILQTAISTAEDMGYTAPELGDKMLEECPGLMAAIENIGEEQQQDQEREEALLGQMDLKIDACTSDGANGTIKNNSSSKVSVFIDVRFFDDGGFVVDTGFASVSGLNPGQTALWDAVFVGDEVDKCGPKIDSVFED